MSGSLSPPDNPHFNKQKNRPSKAGSSVNGPGQTRTADLTLIRGALYQLSYKPDSKFPTELGRHRSRSPASVQSFRPASDALPRRTEKIGKFAGKPAIVWHALVSDRPAHRRAPRRPGFGSIAKGAHMRSSFSHRVHSALVLALLAGTTAHAQLAEPLAGRLEAQVFNPATNTWGNTLTVAPASRIEFRFIVSYTGTNTNVFALGGITYQPTFGNIDNTASDGGIDQTLPWRNNGNQGSTIANSMLSASEGQSGNSLTSYGRVVYGDTASSTTSLNAITTHRHGGDFASNNAPTGSWLRLAGNSVITWPLPTLSQAEATAPNLNNINRGIFANQTGITNPVGGNNTLHVSGTQNLIIFRGALQLSDLATARTIDLSSAAGTQQRIGAVNSPNDTRFMTWQINNFGTTTQVGVQTLPATIQVIPAPTTTAVIAGLLLTAARRRRTPQSDQSRTHTPEFQL